MKATAVFSVLVSFAIGVIIGIFGAVTLRHEIWPIADRVGILVIYAATAGLVFLVLLVWYLRMWSSFRGQLGEPWSTLVFQLFNFLIVFFFMLLVLGMGVFFVAIG